MIPLPLFREPCTAVLPGRKLSERSKHILELLSVKQPRTHLEIAGILRIRPAHCLTMLSRLHGHRLVIRTKTGDRRTGFHGPSEWALTEYREIKDGVDAKALASCLSRVATSTNWQSSLNEQ